MLLLSVATALVFSTSALAQNNAPASTGPAAPLSPTSKPASAPAAVATGQVESEDLTTSDQPKSNFSFQNEDMAKVLEAYSRLAGVKIVIDPSLRGRVTILNPHTVTIQQAFDDLSMALSLEGYGFSRVGDTLVVRSARNLQRGLIEVRTQLPPLKPERMVTYVMKLKNIPAMGVNRDIRILLSKDGELVPDANSNSLIISDWTSNLHRVHALMLEIDVPANTKMKGKNAAAAASASEQPRPAAPPKGKSGN